MYKRVMVPLDGSELAECVLPHVEIIARNCLEESVVFVRVVEPYILLATAGDYVSPTVWTRIETEQRAIAEAYLEQLSQKIDYGSVNVKTEVLEGSIAQSLIDYTTKSGTDLIIIATHGRSGLSRWVWGSVAERVLHSAMIPVMIITPPSTKKHCKVD